MSAVPARSHPELPTSPDHGRRATWWQRHEAFLQTAAAVVAVALLTAIWWRVAGSKPAAEDALLTDRDGRSPNLALLTPELHDAVNRTVREGRLQFAPVPAELQPRDGGEPRSVPAAFLPLSPVGVKVRARRPPLRWTSCVGATGYVVHLQQHPNDRAAGPVVPVSPELPGTRTEWTPPDSLIPGAVYTWQVEARRDDHADAVPRPVTPEARFQVLDEARGRELDDVERRFARFPLIMAVALARAGLADEATGRLAELTREHPQSNAALRLQRGAEATRMRGRELER